MQKNSRKSWYNTKQHIPSSTVIIHIAMDKMNKDGLDLLNRIKYEMRKRGVKEVLTTTIFQLKGNGWGLFKPNGLKLGVAVKQHDVGLVVEGHFMKLAPVVAAAAATGTEAYDRFQHLPLSRESVMGFMARFTTKFQKEMMKELLRPLIGQIVNASDIQGSIIDVILETVEFDEFYEFVTINDRRILTEKAFRAMFVLGQRAEAKADEEAAAAAAATGSGMQQEPLTAQQLALASPEQQKNMIGERLYPLIHKEQPDPDLAGKITGMLLEMDNSELLHLLEAPDALKSKIQEAIDVLAAAAKAAAKAAAGNGDEEHKEKLSDAVATAAAASPAIVSGAALCSTDDGEEEHKESDAGADAEASGGTYAAAAALSGAAAALSGDGHEELKEHDDHEEVTNKTWLLHCDLRRKRKKLFEKVNGLIAERRKLQKESREFRQLELQIGNVYKTIKGINDQIEETNPKCKCGENVRFYNNDWYPLCQRCDKARKTSSRSKTVGRMATCGKRGNRLMQLHG